jgi:hypothetical protein
MHAPSIIEIKQLIENIAHILIPAFYYLLFLVTIHSYAKFLNEIVIKHNESILV